MKIVAHRGGAKDLAPENTIAALNKGLDSGASMLEFDARVTSDKVAVLHHYKKLISANGEKLRINQHSFKELLEHKPDLATLAEVLKSFGSKTQLYIEVKPAEDVTAIVKDISEYLANGGSKTNLFLASKSQKTLLELKAKLPDIALIVTEPWSGVRGSRRARQLKTKTVCMNQRWLWFGFIRSFSRNYELYAYTLNDPSKAKRWQRYGLAGVVTDYPERFR